MTRITRLHRASLTPCERLVLDFLEEATRRCYQESFFATKTIASAVGCCVRTVELALRKLESLRLIDIVKDAAINTKRRLVLLWRKPTDGPLQMNSVGANSCDRPAHNFAPTRPVPPHPPIEESEDDRERDGDDDDETSLPAPPPEPIPPPEPSSSARMDSPHPKPNPNRGEKRKATAGEIADLVAKAEAVVGKTDWTATKAKALAKMWGVSWVSAALDQADVKRKKDGRVGWGYVARTLIGFQAEGGPAAAPAKPSTWEEQLAEIAKRSPLMAELRRKEREETDRMEEEMWAAHLAREEARAHAARLV